MRKFIGSIMCMLFLFLTVPGISQKMTSTTKSKEAKDLAGKRIKSFYENAELAQGV